MDTMKCLAALRDFFEQAPGFETANYSTYADYRKDYRQALKDLHECRNLYELVRWHDFTIDEVDDATRAFSGRLRYSFTTERWNYTAGQYWPMEYRSASATVLRSLDNIVSLKWDKANAKTR